MVRMEYSVTAVICPTSMPPPRVGTPPAHSTTAMRAPMSIHTTGIATAKSRFRRIMLSA